MCDILVSWQDLWNIDEYCQLVCHQCASEQGEGRHASDASPDTRTGQVYGQGYRRKRQKEFIPFLEYLDRALPARITRIHVVCDNVSVHHGKEVQKWLKRPIARG